MKHLKMIGLAAIAATAMLTMVAGDASATTLEVKGVKQTSAVELTATLESGFSLVTQKTDGTFVDTCTAAHWTSKTSSATTGTAVSGPVAGLSFSSCTNEKIVVDKTGTVSIENISGTTNGTVKWAGTEVTVPSPFGTLNCVTGTGTDVGTLTGVASGRATFHFRAVINCGFLAPSETWEGPFVITTPEGTGVTG
jgi:hypothetical protein